jgi:hypothetical protein
VKSVDMWAVRSTNTMWRTMGGVTRDPSRNRVVHIKILVRPSMDSHQNLWPGFDMCVELNFKPWCQSSKEIKSMPLATTLRHHVTRGCT